MAKRKRKRPAGRPMRRARLDDAFYQRMIRNPNARIPYVLVEHR